MGNSGYYQLAAGVDVVPLPEEAILFRSCTLAVKIEGSMAALLGRRVLPLLDRPRSLDYLESRLPDLPPRASEGEPGIAGGSARARALGGGHSPRAQSAV